MSVKNLSCPYCKKRTTREKLVNHIDYNHSNELPEGFSALRMAFHVANNKPLEYRRPCRICKQPTEWDEKKGRYNFLCGDPTCKEKYVAFMKQSMGEKYGAYRPTATPEGLAKMLAGRRISGKYKWSDGTIFTYTGSYELATLKFMDRGLEIKSEDLMVPGPILEYEYNGEKHLYISDIYYRPYNLLIEVKDGGTSINKNKEYAITRAKQIAKEKYVIEKTDYNYLRLTDKDCSQLMAVFADLKMHLVENDKERVIHVNENTPIAAVNPIVGFVPSKDVVIINYMKKKTFVDDSDYAIADSPKFDTIFARDKDGVLRKKDKSILHGSYYTPYIVRDKRQQITEALSENIDKEVSESFIYETVFGHPIFSKDQIKYESSAELYEDYYQGLENIKDYIINESKDASKLDKNFKKKNDKDFIFKDLEDSSLNKYLEKDTRMKAMITNYRKSPLKDGEVAIDKEDNKIAGYVIVNNKTNTIGPLYVNKKYRGYGLSNALVDDAVDIYKGNNLGVFKDNEVAMNLYKKHGFKIQMGYRPDKEENAWFKMVKESSLITEDTKASDDFIKVEKFNKELNKFKYISGAEKTLSSAEFEKQKGGTCWDYVNYEYKFFKRNHIPVDAYMFVMDRGSGDIVTHTFCIITVDIEKHWFESAWKKWKGIYEKDLNGVVRELVDHYGKHSYSVFKYTPGDGLENVSNNSFFDKSTQNLVKDVIVKEASVSEKDLEKNAKLKPIFIVSTFTNTRGGKVIKAALESNFSHSLISFDSNLSKMYSFDNSYDERYETKPKDMKGLTIDNFKRYKDTLSDGDIKVICIMVNDKTYNTIKSGVDYYVKHRDETTYSLVKLSKWVFGNNQLSSFGDMTMFCSEFVDAVLKNAKIDISGKSSSNTSPLDLGSFRDKNNFFELYQGKISNYDPKRVEEQIEEMRKTIKYKDLNTRKRSSMKDPYDHDIKAKNHMKEITQRGIKIAKNKFFD